MGVQRLAAFGAVVLGMFVIGTSTASASANCPGDDQAPTASTLADAAASVLCDVNSIRTARGLQPLTADLKLQRAAQGLADDQARHHYVAHVDSAGRTLDDRVELVGYASVDDVVMLLENVDWGAGTRIAPSATVNAWMNSSSHRANMLNPDVRDLGIGVALGTVEQMGDMQGAFYVADFGTREHNAKSSSQTTSSGTSSTSGTRSTTLKRCKARSKKASRRHVRKHTRKHSRKHTRRVVCR